MLRLKKEKPMAKKVQTELLQALDFVKAVAPNGGVVGMGDNVLSVVTPVMRAYHPISDDLRFTTDLDKFHAAIKTIGERAYSATIAQTLKIAAGKFKIELPIIEVEAIRPVQPEEINQEIDERFLTALFNASIPTTPGASRVQFAGVFLSDAQTCVGTNGNVVVEAWHGNNIATGIIVPTDFVRVLERMKKAGMVVTHVYGDERLFAVRYANNAILITQLYVEQYVNHKAIFALADKANPVPDELESLKAAFDELSPFGDILSVTAGSIDCGNASITMLNQHAYAFSVANWQTVKSLVVKLDAHSLENMIVFHGPFLRGCIVKVDKNASDRLGRH